MSKTGFEKKCFVLGWYTSFKQFNEIKYSETIVSYLVPESVPDRIYSLSWVKRFGVGFKSGLSVSFEFNDFCPIFGYIQEILTPNDKDILL